MMWPVCLTPFSQGDTPQKDRNLEEREKRAQEIGPRKKQVKSRSIFHVLVCERKELFIQNAASGDRKTERRALT